MLTLTQREIDLIDNAFRFAEAIAEYTPEELAEIDALLSKLDREHERQGKRTS